MIRYRCRVCGFIYEPEDGDKLRGIAAGTPFDALPGGWVCPICGASRDDFDPLSAPTVLPTPGIYRHYKGNDYRLLGMARHSETLEDMVVYQALYGDQGLWVRPAGMWSEEVLHQGRMQPRFCLLAEPPGQEGAD